MLDYRRNDLTDKLYNRYLRSFDYTMETEDLTGSEFYHYYVLELLRGFQKDIKDVHHEIKLYKHFRRRERRYYIKLERLNFVPMDNEEEIKLLSLKKRIVYRYKKWLLKFYNKRFKKLIQKLWEVIPEGEYGKAVKDLLEDVDEKVSDVEIETQEEVDVSTKDNLDKSAEVDARSDNCNESGADFTLIAEDVSEETSKENVSGNDKLEAFFNNVKDCEEKEKEENEER